MVSILVIYLVGVFTMTIGIRGFDVESKINLIPFRSLYLLIYQLIRSARLWGIKNIPHELTFMVPGLRNFFGNILLLIPLGYLAPLLKKNIDRWWKTVILGVGVSLLIEIIQLMTHRGYFDIDDVILNSLGCWIGWLCYRRWLLEATE